MRTALVLHLYYKDLAFDLIKRVSRLSGDFDVFATGEAIRDTRVTAALRRLPASVEVIEGADEGRDIGPFLTTLPILLERGYELFCKLHTKRGDSGYGSLWRKTFYDALLGSPALSKRILNAFEEDNSLGMVGPYEFYLSANREMLRNAEKVMDAARVCFPRKELPADWGFFAGTMFWGRTAQFRPLLQLRKFGINFGRETGVDGYLEHAIERLLGMIPLMQGARVGFVRSAVDGNDPELEITAATDPVSQDTLAERLLAVGRSRIKQASPSRLQELISKENPLLHYIRHGATSDLDPNPYFHNAWYVRTNTDFAEYGGTPLRHFIAVGGRQKRNPSPMFDVRYYLATHPSRFESGVDALAHFLERGETMDEPPRRPDLPQTEGKNWLSPRRFLRRFNPAVERAFLASLRSAPVRKDSATTDCRFSVVMPLVGEAQGLEDSLDSILAQTFKDWEILLVDAGSTQEVRNRVKRHLFDSRIRLLNNGRGLASARNQGLKASSGEIVAYLEPGCRWRADYLATMADFMRVEDWACAHCITAYKDSNRVYGFQGEQFDRDAFIEASYVDLNAFCHRRRLYEDLGGFKEGPASAWDLIVRYSQAARPGFAPFVGCEHQGWSVAIKSPAVREQAGEGAANAIASHLETAFRRLGRRCRVDYRGEWYRHPAQPQEVAIVLRGSLAYEPQPAQTSVLWNFSHDERVEYEELDSFDIVYVTSKSRRALLDTIARPPVLALPISIASRANSSGTSKSAGELEPSVQAQARVIVADVKQLLHRTAEENAPAHVGAKTPIRRGRAARRRRVHLILRIGAHGPEISNFIRLLSPLTSNPAAEIELSFGDQDDIARAAECDVCIVSRTAVDSPKKVNEVLKRLRSSKTRLVVDNDDAYSLIDERNPFHAELIAQNTCMEELMSHADQCWFSTRSLADLYGSLCASVAIVPNALDPRIWSTKPARSRSARSGLRMLYMGSRNHADDLAIIVPALDAYEKDTPGGFELTVIGVADSVPKRPWLHHLRIPGQARAYPRFVRWLVRQGPFDVGLSPLSATPFNACKSDVKFLDYSALGLVAVLSDAPAYRTDPKIRTLALMTKNTPKAWTAALAAIAADRAMYRVMADKARKYVWAKRCVDMVAEKHVHLIRQLMDN